MDAANLSDTWPTDDSLQCQKEGPSCRKAGDTCCVDGIWAIGGLYLTAHKPVARWQRQLLPVCFERMLSLRQSFTDWHSRKALVVYHKYTEWQTQTCIPLLTLYDLLECWRRRAPSCCAETLACLFSVFVASPRRYCRSRQQRLSPDRRDNRSSNGVVQYKKSSSDLDTVLDIALA